MSHFSYTTETSRGPTNAHSNPRPTCRQVLRPGGMFLSVDWDFRVMDYDKTLLPAFPRDHPRHAWFPCFVRALGTAIRARMGNIDAATLLPKWLRGHRSFEAVESADLWIPTQPMFPKSMLGWRCILRLLLEILSFIQSMFIHSLRYELRKTDEYGG